MAFDYEGATWISREKTVMNPYFGDEMLNCGVVRTAIAPSEAKAD
jgi:Cu(I)/Ag(I) efflux system membrane fusion protein